MRVGVLLYHALEREALQHAMHRRALQPGARGEIEQPGTGAVVRGDLAQQQQGALYTLSAGQARGLVLRIFSDHGKRSPNRERPHYATLPALEKYRRLC